MTITSLIVCPKCNREMRLLGIEAENDVRDIFTFECPACRRLEVRGVLVDDIRATRS
jgi:predicted  nucleic acid-binding Zn ribbon protein